MGIPFQSGFAAIAEDVAPMSPHALRMLAGRAVAHAGADPARLLWLADLFAGTGRDFVAEGLAHRGLDTGRLAQLLKREADKAAAAP
jgi:hypothetical protein